MKNLVAVSYVPLLIANPNVNWLSMDNEQLGEAIHALGSVAEVNSQSDGVVWMGNGKETFVAFAFDNSKAIADHFMAWSENKPERWFSLDGLVKKGAYSIVLTPNVLKSVERIKMNLQLKTGYPLPSDIKVKVFMKPIHFVSNGPTEMSKNMKSNFKRKVRVGFIETSDVKNGLVTEESFQNFFHEVGSFTLHKTNNDFMKGLMEMEP